MRRTRRLRRNIRLTVFDWACKDSYCSPVSISMIALYTSVDEFFQREHISFACLFETTLSSRFISISSFSIIFNSTIYSESLNFEWLQLTFDLTERCFL